MEAKKPGAAGIRVAESELTDKVLDELIELSGEWENENSCRGYRKNERSDIEGNRIFLALDGDAVIGYLFGHVEKAENIGSVLPDGEAYFEIEELFVRSEYRSAGIGRKLFSAAEDAVSDEVSCLMLGTATKNWRAILHFYLEELGMSFWSARLFKRIEKRAER